MVGRDTRGVNGVRGTSAAGAAWRRCFACRNVAPSRDTGALMRGVRTPEACGRDSEFRASLDGCRHVDSGKACCSLTQPRPEPELDRQIALVYLQFLVLEA